MFWVLTCTVHLTVFFVTSSTLLSCQIWRLLRVRRSLTFLDIQAIIECGFTLKRVRDMARTYSQMHHADAYSEHSSNICSVWQNHLVFVYQLSGSGFESSCSHLKFRFRACFEKEVPWHSGSYRVWIHFEMRTWHDKTIQS